MKMIAAATKTSFGKYDLTETAGTLKACGSDIGGGSEVLIIEGIVQSDNRQFSENWGVQYRKHLWPETTRIPNVW